MIRSIEMTYWTIVPTPTPTIVPQTTYHLVMNNMTDSGFNLFISFQDVISPYAYAAGGGLSAATFLIMSSIFYSMWLGHGNLKLATLVGFLFGCSFFIGNGLGVVLPLPVYGIAYGAIAASLAGILLSAFKNVG
jgi:hypothetical protein